MNSDIGSSHAADSLNPLLSGASLKTLSPEAIAKFDSYLALILRWNTRTNLTAVRDVDGIVSRHFVESIACAQLLPEGIATLLDFGSGAGFPGIPVAICRPEIRVTLAESQSKKAAFLQETARTLHLPVRVFAGRAETMKEQFDCVAMRAVDRMSVAVSDATCLIRSGGWIAVMTTVTDPPVIQGAAGRDFVWPEDPIRLPGSDQRVLALGRKLVSRA